MFLFIEPRESCWKPITAQYFDFINSTKVNSFIYESDLFLMTSFTREGQLCPVTWRPHFMHQDAPILPSNLCVRSFKYSFVPAGTWVRQGKDALHWVTLCDRCWSTVREWSLPSNRELASKVPHCKARLWECHIFIFHSQLLYYGFSTEKESHGQRQTNMLIHTPTPVSRETTKGCSRFQNPGHS
jgi:hypothetical protein